MTGQPDSDDELREQLAHADDSDTIVVARLDRLGRSLTHLVEHRYRAQ